MSGGAEIVGGPSARTAADCSTAAAGTDTRVAERTEGEAMLLRCRLPGRPLAEPEPDGAAVDTAAAESTVTASAHMASTPAPRRPDQSNALISRFRLPRVVSKGPMASGTEAFSACNRPDIATPPPKDAE